MIDDDDENDYVDLTADDLGLTEEEFAAYGGLAGLEHMGGMYQETFRNQLWRLNNLYKVQSDETGVHVFRMRDLQLQMYNNRWYRNVILKARQLGSSTFWCLFILDSILFSDEPLRCGIIAQTVPHAKGLLGKLKFAFENLDEGIKESFGFKMKATAEKLVFTTDFCKHASTVAAGITFRSDTCDILLVSELGKMAAQMPGKAREVITGAFPTVHSGGMIIVESTAEGTDGYLFDLVATATEIRDNPARSLGSTDFHLHFFAWWQKEQYQSDDPFPWSEEDERYFSRMALRGYKFTKAQKNWWARQHNTLGADIYREFPTYEAEAFMSTGRALILARPMIEAEDAGHVGPLQLRQDLPVVTCWDIGPISAVWIYQYLGPTHLAFLEYLEGEHADFDLWKITLDKLAAEKGYRYAAHAFPWDGDSKKAMTGTAQYFAERAGFENVCVVERQPFDLQVRVAHMMMKTCFFDREGTALGRQRLLGYRRLFNQTNSSYEERPDKGLASHGSEAWITGLFFQPSDIAIPETPGGPHPGAPGSDQGGKHEGGLLKSLFGGGKAKKGDKGEATIHSADGVQVYGKGLFRRLMS